MNCHCPNGDGTLPLTFPQARSRSTTFNKIKLWKFLIWKNSFINEIKLWTHVCVRAHFIPNTRANSTKRSVECTKISTSSNSTNQNSNRYKVLNQQVMQNLFQVYNEKIDERGYNIYPEARFPPSENLIWRLPWAFCAVKLNSDAEPCTRRANKTEVNTAIITFVFLIMEC